MGVLDIVAGGHKSGEPIKVDLAEPALAVMVRPDPDAATTGVRKLLADAVEVADG
jgi:hypothetical protein